MRSAATPTLQMPQEAHSDYALVVQHLGIIGYTFEEDRGDKLIKRSTQKLDSACHNTALNCAGRHTRRGMPGSGGSESRRFGLKGLH